LRVRLIEECFRGAEHLLPGDILTVSDAQAATLIQEGLAVPAVESPAVERR